MEEEAVEQTSSRRRRACKALSADKRKPRRGTRFPSRVLGDNVRSLRQRWKLYQGDLAEVMNELGFAGWSRVTVSGVERGVRMTSVDELFALAVALKTHVVKLLDPHFSGDEGTGIDLGFPWPIEGETSDDPRSLILSDDDPWRRDREPPERYKDYRERLPKLDKVEG